MALTRWIGGVASKGPSLDGSTRDPGRRLRSDGFDADGTGERRGHEPELIEGVHDADELVECDGFLNTSVRVQIVAANDVLPQLGAGDHQDRDPSELRIALDLGKNLLA